MALVKLDRGYVRTEAVAYALRFSNGNLVRLVSGYLLDNEETTSAIIAALDAEYAAQGQAPAVVTATDTQIDELTTGINLARDAVGERRFVRDWLASLQAQQA